MGVLNDLSDIVNRLTGGNSGTPEHISQWIDSRVQGAAATAPVASRWSSLWTYNKSNGANGAAPGAVAAPTRATTGAMGQANPGGGRQKWLLGVSAMGNSLGTLMLYDRLLHIGGLNATTTTAQTVGGTMTRYATNGTCPGNMIFAEIYTIIGTTATTLTCSYTNQAGTSGKITQAAAFGGTGLREVTRMIPLALADGDTGVQAVASTTVLASTTTAGSFGITVARPLLMIPITANMVGENDCISGLPSVPEILTDACLAWAWFPNGTTVPQFQTFTRMIEA